MLERTIFSPLFHAVLGIAAFVAAFVFHQQSSWRTDEAGLDGLVAGLLIGGAILLGGTGGRRTPRERD